MAILYNYKFNEPYGAEYGASYGLLKSPFFYNNTEDCYILGIYACETITVLTYEEFLAYAEMIEFQFIAWDQVDIDYWNASYEARLEEANEGHIPIVEADYEEYGKESYEEYCKQSDEAYIAYLEAEYDYWQASYEEYCKQSDEKCGQNSQDS